MREVVFKLLLSSIFAFWVNFIVAMARQYYKVPHPAYSAIISKAAFLLAVGCIFALIWVK